MRGSDMNVGSSYYIVIDILKVQTLLTELGHHLPTPPYKSSSFSPSLLYLFHPGLNSVSTILSSSASPHTESWQVCVLRETSLSRPDRFIRYICLFLSNPAQTGLTKCQSTQCNELFPFLSFSLPSRPLPPLFLLCNCWLFRRLCHWITASKLKLSFALSDPGWLWCVAHARPGHILHMFGGYWEAICRFGG